MKMMSLFAFAAIVGFAGLAVLDALPRHPPLKEVMCAITMGATACDRS
jgi:hypothetical protein